MRVLFSKPKFYFAIIAPLLLATAILKVDCPTCHGQGSVVGSNNMNAVSVISVESRILYSIQDACTGYIVTQSHPFIVAFNSSKEDAEGWLTVDLLNTDTNELLATQYLPVSVTAETTVSLNTLVVFAFYSADIPPEHLRLSVRALTGTVPDITCNGSGKISINAYFLADAFKGKLVADTVQSNPFGPYLPYGEPGSQEWMDWHEIDY